MPYNSNLNITIELFADFYDTKLSTIPCTESYCIQFLFLLLKSWTKTKPVKGSVQKKAPRKKRAIGK